MIKTFAEVVKRVKQLSFAEQEEVHRLLVEERRREIRENAETSLKEYHQGKLKFFSNIGELMDSLSND
jgi:hypothetical protein